MSIPRSEYPRPQFVRSDWLCLNGEWEFEIDPGDSGLERGLLERQLEGKITVPFCPESRPHSPRLGRFLPENRCPQRHWRRDRFSPSKAPCSERIPHYLMV